jgi:hypothetical protein
MATWTDAIWTDEDQARLVALVKRAVARGDDHVAVPAEFARHMLESLCDGDEEE